MAMSTSRSKNGAIAEINVTPMADVMIVLLIIFMVTTPLITQAPVPLPEAAHGKEETGDKTLVILLDAQGQLKVDEKDLGPFEPALAQVTELTEAAAKPVWIKADRTVPYAWVSQVLDACRRGGAEDVHLAADLPEVRG
jgi:biopolymer transport protein ExbD